MENIIGHVQDKRSHRANHAANQKAAPDTSSNQIKASSDWLSGHELMTGAQASYLKTLTKQTQHPETFDPDLDKAEVSKRIDQLNQEREED